MKEEFITQPNEIPVSAPWDASKGSPDISTVTSVFLNRSYQRILAPRAIDAAVLIPLVEKNGEICVLFELRSSRIDQGGEVCFPGGRVEYGESAEETVVRECAEELLIREEQVSLIAPMYKLMGPGGSEISAWLGRVEDYEGTYSADEVQQVMLVPLTSLLSMQVIIHDSVYHLDPGTDFPYELIQNGENYYWHTIRKRYFFYRTEPVITWGMTAEILYQFLEQLKAGLLQMK